MKKHKQEDKLLRNTIVIILIIILLAWGVGYFRETVEASSDKPIAAELTEAKVNTQKYILKSLGQEDIHKGDLILINNWTSYKFPYEDNLVSLYDYKTSSYSVKDKNVLLDNSIIGNLNKMLDDFNKKFNNKSVNVISGYRTKKYQQKLFDNSVKENGLDHANKYVAKAGNSEHHTGLAVDFGVYEPITKKIGGDFEGTGIYSWINKNAYKYGFVMRYEDSKKDITGIYYEPWHFRYVGTPHSYIMNQKGFCLEEYIEFLKQYEYGTKHLNVNVDMRKYEIYFTKSSDVYVPQNKEYTISGNNIDGFIITVFD